VYYPNIILVTELHNYTTSYCRRYRNLSDSPALNHIASVHTTLMISPENFRVTSWYVSLLSPELANAVKFSFVFVCTFACYCPWFNYCNYT